jgi:hypothetical protein
VNNFFHPLYAGYLVMTLTTANLSVHAEDVADVDSSRRADTLKAENAKASSNMVFVGRLHSLGFFGYGGVIANDGPAADITFTYTRRSAGLMLVKAFDVYDLHSHYNFALSLFYKQFRLSNKVTVTPFAGFALDQTSHFAGKGSDVMVLLVSSYRTPSGFSLEHCARFSNVVVEDEYFDWLNRFRLAYSKKHIDLTLTCWHNNSVFHTGSYTSLGFNAAYARIPLSQSISISTGFTAVVTARASREQEFEKKNGLLLTIATTFD